MIFPLVIGFIGAVLLLECAMMRDQPSHCCIDRQIVVIKRMIEASHQTSGD
jgi:hypothetical protein